MAIKISKEEYNKYITPQRGAANGGVTLPGYTINAGNNGAYNILASTVAKDYNSVMERVGNALNGWQSRDDMMDTITAWENLVKNVEELGKSDENVAANLGMYGEITNTLNSLKNAYGKYKDKAAYNRGITAEAKSQLQKDLRWLEEVREDSKLYTAIADPEAPQPRNYRIKEKTYGSGYSAENWAQLDERINALKQELRTFDIMEEAKNAVKTAAGLELPAQDYTDGLPNGKYLSTDERMVYNKLAHEYGKDSSIVKSYWNAIEETVNTRKGQETYNKLKNTALLKYLYGAGAGVASWWEGTKNALFNKDDTYYAATSTDVANSLLREDLQGTVGGVAYDLLNSAGRMAPSLLMGKALALTGMGTLASLGGAATMGLSVRGEAYADMINAGFDEGKASLYADLSALSETTLTYLLSGIEGVGSKLTSNKLQNIVGGVDNALAAFAIKHVGEAVEEGLQPIIEMVMKKAITGEIPDLQVGDVLYSALLGYMTSAVLSGGDLKPLNLSKISTITPTLNGIALDNSTQNVLKLGLTAPENTTMRVIAERVTNGEYGAYDIAHYLSLRGNPLNDIATERINSMLTQMGVSAKSADVIADTIQDISNGKKLTTKQMEALNNNSQAMSALVHEIADAEGTVNSNFGKKLTATIETSRAALTEATTQAFADDVKTPTDGTESAQTGTEGIETVETSNVSPTETKAVRTLPTASWSVEESNLPTETKSNVQKIANLLGKQVRVYSKGAVDGYIENGSISGDTIYINDQSKNPVGVILKHELTHTLEKAENYALFSESVFTSKTFKDWLKTDIASARKELIADRIAAKDSNFTREGITPDELNTLADQEIIADFVGEMLFTDKDGLNSVIESLEGKERTSFIEAIVNAIKALIDKIKGKDTTLERELRKLEKEYSALLKESATSTDTKSTNANKGSYSSIAQSVFGDAKLPISDFEKRFNDGSYKETEGYKAFVDKCLNNMKQTHPDLTEEESRNEIEKSIAGIMRVAIAAKNAGYDIFDDASAREARDSKKRLLFSSLEPNSDYFTSHDISIICDKRKNFGEIYDAIVAREEEMGVPADKRFFSNIDNYFYIHKVLADKGLTQPCRQCYVDTMRKNLAPMATSFINLVKETDEKNKNNTSLYNENGELKSTNSKLRKRVREYFEKAAKEENNDITLGSLTHQMLTTAEGLATLRLKAPRIYEAFNSFYGQSKPKMPKEATPYRFGELTALLTDNNGKINAKLVNRINSTGGFRLQSYSDFQITNFVDVLQVLFEAGTLGLAGHAYTKVPAFLEATKNTNLKRNISVFLYEDDGNWVLDRNDSFPGKSLEDIYRKYVSTDESGNTGIIAVSQNNDMSAFIMANVMIAYGIPFHKSGALMATVRDTDVRTADGRIVKGYANILDHTSHQNETNKLDGKMVKKAINIYGGDFTWDFENKENLSQKELIEKNLRAYLDACDRKGYYPKFKDYVLHNDAFLNLVLKWSKELGVVDNDATIDDISFKHGEYRVPYGYYKFIGDFSMFAPGGEASPHDVLSLKDYDFDVAVAFFKKGNNIRRNEILQQFANDGERRKYRDSNMTADELEKVLAQKRAEVVDEALGIKKTEAVKANNTANTNPTANPDIRHSVSREDRAQILKDLQDGKITAEEADDLLWGKEPLEETRLTEEDAETKLDNASDMVRRVLKKFQNTATKETNIKQSKFAESVQNAEWLGDDFKEAANNDEFINNYVGITNKATLKEAAETLAEGGKEAAIKWYNKPAARATYEDVAIGFILLERAKMRGGLYEQLAITQKLREIGTISGQTVQAFSILGRMTPEGMLAYAQTELGQALDVMRKIKTQRWLEKYSDRFNLTEAEAEEITRKIRAAANLPEGSRAKQILLAEIAAIVQEKIPPKSGDGLRALQRTAMLLNPKTHVRNIMGNVGATPLFLMSDVFGGLTDMFVTKGLQKQGIGATRTTPISTAFAKNDDGSKAITASVNAFKQGFEYAYDDWRRGFSTRNIAQDRYGITGAKSLDEHTKNPVYNALAKAFNKVDRFNSFLLEAGDRPFYQAWFIRSLQAQMRLNHVTEPTQEMVDIATQEALSRTWQDDNLWTNTAAGLKHALNKFPLANLSTIHSSLPDYGLGDMLIKFTKTLANLAKAIVDFSPLGAIYAGKYGAELKREIQKGAYDPKVQKQLVDAVGKAISGTMLYAFLASALKAGIIAMKGKNDDDDDVRAFENYILGIPEYSIKIGNTWFTYDWAQPLGSIMAAVSDYMYASENIENDKFYAPLVEAIKSGGDVLLRQSFLKSLQDFFSTDGDIFTKVFTTALGEPSVYVPRIFSQFAELFDESRRETYTNDDFETALNKVKVKIPFLRNTLEESVNVMGETAKNPRNDVWNAFIAPGNVYSKSEGEAINEIYRVYQSTGEKSAIPPKADYAITANGVKYQLSVQERTKMQRTMGSTAAEIIDAAMDDKRYSKLTDAEKLKLITNIYSYSKALAKSEITYSYDFLHAIYGDALSEAQYNKLSDKQKKMLAKEHFLASYDDVESGNEADYFLDKLGKKSTSSSSTNKKKTVNKVINTK